MFEYRILIHIEYRTFRTLETFDRSNHRISNLFESSRHSIDRTNELRTLNLSKPANIRSIEPSNIELPIRIFIEWFSNPNLDPGSRNKQDEQTFLKCPKWPKATWNRLWFILLLVPRQVWDAYILIFRKLFILFSPGTWELEVTRALGLTRALGS